MGDRRTGAAYRYLLGAGLALSGCGAGWQAPEAPPPRPVDRPPVAGTPPRVPTPDPPPDVAVDSIVAPGRPLAPAPPGVLAESNYPVPRIWEWTLSNGARVWFRRSVGSPGRFVLRAVAAGGWRGIPGGAMAEMSDGPGRLRARLLAEEALVEGGGVVTELGAALEELAGVLGADLPAVDAPSPEVLLDAALAGGAPDGDPPQTVLAARFGRPGAFRVLISGDVPPDSLGGLAAAALARIRTSPEATLLPTDSALAAAPPRGRTLRHPGDGRGARALVGFRGRVAGPTADRRPDHVRAGLEVLAHALRAALGASGDVATTVAWDGASATLVLEVMGEPDAEAARVLEAAGGLDVTEASVARARGAAARAHDRAVGTPEGWVEWLHFLSQMPVDPRAPQEFARTLRAVPAERVRALAAALLDPAAAAVVMVGE